MSIAKALRYGFRAVEELSATLGAAFAVMRGRHGHWRASAP